MAEAQAALGDGVGAEKAYRKAMSLSPADIEAHVGLARLFARNNRAADALGVAAKLRAAQPKSAAGHVLAGELHAQAKRYSQAIEAYEQAYAVAPSGDLVVRLHATRTTAGERTEDGALVQWLDAHPNDFGVRLYLANRHYLSARFKEAAEQYAVVVELDPNNALALNNLASTYLELNDARALAMAEAAHALQPEDADILDTVGVARMRHGKPEDAVDALKKAITRAPDSSDMLLHYALALDKTGDRTSARTHLRRLMASGKPAALSAEALALLGE
jgi:cytochrome c-type biogenesis protein CcmH/NrfG